MITDFTSKLFVAALPLLDSLYAGNMAALKRATHVDKWSLLLETSNTTSVSGLLAGMSRNIEIYKQLYPGGVPWGFLRTDASNVSTPFGPAPKPALTWRGISWLTLLTYIAVHYTEDTGDKEVISSYIGGSVKFLILDDYVHFMVTSDNAQAYRELSEVGYKSPNIQVYPTDNRRTKLLFAATSYHLLLLTHCMHRLKDTDDIAPVTKPIPWEVVPADIVSVTPTKPADREFSTADLIDML